MRSTGALRAVATLIVLAAGLFYTAYQLAQHL